MLLEHQVIWCQGEAVGPLTGERKAYTEKDLLWYM